MDDLVQGQLTKRCHDVEHPLGNLFGKWSTFMVGDKPHRTVSLQENINSEYWELIQWVYHLMSSETEKMEAYSIWVYHLQEWIYQNLFFCELLNMFGIIYIYYIALINYSNIKNWVFYWLGHYFLVTWLIWKALLDWEISILSYTQITRIFRKGMLSIAGRNPAEDHPWWKSDRNQPNEWHYCLSTSDLIS